MNRDIIKSPAARDDLLEIFITIGQDNVDAAHRVIAAAEETFNRLAAMPGIGRRWESRIPHLMDLRVTTIPKYRNYLVFYRVHPESIQIVRVLHGARDVEAVLEEGPL